MAIYSGSAMKNNRKIKTNRLTLRNFKSSDINLLVLYLNDPEVTKYITNAISQPYKKSDATWWINVGSKSPYIKAIEFNGTFVGCISATIGDFEYNRSAELGYWLAREYWNQGITTEVVKQFSNMIFNSGNIIRLFVSVVSLNKASICVLEKNNFTHDGLLKKASYKHGLYFDECLLSKVCY
jgi:RimJ/RimL family protein N-acetyltransferase